ncbi:MAG TPA: zinc ribbon domain-containing protein [Anaerolineaceae bacterium]|nr:zinc ribbon domain-containing protein [Anaerolineaceae bacterium]
MENQQIICPACGAALKPGAKFCVKCGHAINLPQEPAPAAPTPPVIPPLPVQAPPQMPVNTTQAAPTPPPFPVPQSIPPMPAVVAPQPSPPIPAVTTSQSIPPVPAAAVQVGEQVLTVVGMLTRKTGMFSSVVYHLVVTNFRLIFALQTKEMQAEDINAARERAKSEGKKWLGQIGAQMSTRSGEKYLAYPPDAILLENPQNFMIPLSELKVIETYTGDFDDNAPDTMVVKTMSDQIQFIISNAMGVQRQLKQVLGNRVK